MRDFVRRRALVLALSFALPALGCNRSSAAAAEDALLVFAAASLREVFTNIGKDFERSHPGVKLTFNFAGTQELRTQIEHGAACDVFASADTRHMELLTRAAAVTEPVVFARNEPVLVVAKESAAELRAFQELPRARRLVIGAPEVPIGRYTLELLERAAAVHGAHFRAKVMANVVSKELSVKHVLAKVNLGEADAGIVYRTDAKAAGDRVSVVAIPPALNVVAEYPIAVAKRAPHPTLARAWIDLVLSDAGRHALADAGFTVPARNAQEP